jgi:tRNA(fMet)-specific endonuclease VapC
MNGRLAIDTNAVIAYREGIPEVCDFIEKADKLVMPVIVLGELLYGAVNSARQKENELAVRRFLRQCILITIDEDIAFRYADIRLKLKKSGRLIPENDIWIAATCLEFDVALLTQDGHFNNVSGLQLIGW